MVESPERSQSTTSKNRIDSGSMADSFRGEKGTGKVYGVLQRVSQSKQLTKNKKRCRNLKRQHTTHPMETLGASRSRMAMNVCPGECQDGDRSAPSAKWPNGCFNCWLAFQVESCVYSVESTEYLDLYTVI